MRKLVASATECAMTSGSIRLFVFLALLALHAGCTPRTVVLRNPGPAARGIRYYRPKPYLLVSPYAASEPDARGRYLVTLDEPSDQFVTIQLQYLPDFSEEYAIQVRSGLGQAKVSIQLADGWNLVSINQELDSQFDENLKALASVLEAAAPLVAPPEAGPSVQPEAKLVVRATNVPIGYYEAILGSGPKGEKRLYGWRYVGFVPFASCPISGCGAETLPCGALDLYGLVFENGIMTFKKLPDIQTVGQSGASLQRRPRSLQDTVPPDAAVPDQDIPQPERLPPMDYEAAPP